MTLISTEALKMEIRKERFLVKGSLSVWNYFAALLK